MIEFGVSVSLVFAFVIGAILYRDYAAKAVERKRQKRVADRAIFTGGAVAAESTGMERGRRSRRVAFGRR